MPRIKYHKLGYHAAAMERAYWNDNPSLIAIDTETTGVGWADKPFAATVSWLSPDPMGTEARSQRDRYGVMRSWYLELSGEGAGLGWRRQAEKPLLSVIEFATSIVFHNCKFDLHKLQMLGLDPVVIKHKWDMGMIHDTSVMAHLLDENGRKNLKELAIRYLDFDDRITVPIKSGKNAGLTREVPADEYRLGEARKKLGLRKEDGYHLLPRRVVMPYAMRDTEFTLSLALLLRRKLSDQGLYPQYQEEMQAVQALYWMEDHGFGVDTARLEELISEYGRRVIQGEQALRKHAQDMDFNPNSPVQIQKVLDRKGIKIPDTKEETLEKIDLDFVHDLLQYRQDKKNYTTYLLGLRDEQVDGVFHPSFNPTGARTGRLSSSKGA